MPELPEVETIRRGLEDFIVHQTISQVKVSCEKSFIGPKEVVEGRTVKEVHRRGKALLVELSGGVTMMIHLRMTGQLVYRDDGLKKHQMIHDRNYRDSHSFAGGHPTDTFFTELPDKQTRVYFKMSKGTLYFNDQRKFGFVKVLPTEEVEKDPFIASLGAEPWETKATDLYAVCQRRKGSPIKAVLLDQKVIAGIGNIYADEALFYAKVHPARPAGSLGIAAVRRILKGACEVMDASIESGGSTMATYVRADGTKGNYLEKFAQVFRREGEPCPRCGTEIEKIRVAGRGTHICPKCQKLPRNVGEDSVERRGGGSAAARGSVGRGDDFVASGSVASGAER